MAAPKNSLKRAFKINLLIQKGNEPKLSNRLTKWVLSSGKFIVVLVEIVVIGAFVYRYKLDTDLADIQDLIKEQIPYIQSLANDETLIRKVQFQLGFIKQTKEINPNYTALLGRIATLTPKSIKLNNISINKTGGQDKFTLTITGQTPSNLELSAYIKALRKDLTFQNVELTNISFEGSTVFTISSTLVATGGKN